MLSLENFERLAKAPLNKKAVKLAMIGGGEQFETWNLHLPHLDKHSQYAQIKAVLSELIVANIADAQKINMLESVFVSCERLTNQMRQEYLNTPQSPLSEQKVCVGEVRSLLFLLILAYQSIAFSNHNALSQDGSGASKKNNWLSKLAGGLSGNVVRNGIGIDVVNEPKKLFILSVYRIMQLGYKLMMEFALTYQKTPNSLWRLMNAWYLKAAVLGVDKQCVSRLYEVKAGSIYQQYVYSSLASFVNLFAYRRTDIVNVFKLLPTWATHVKTTFTANEHLKLFVNLQADTPPELITPYSSVNPYSKDYVCLFFDVAPLFEHLTQLTAKNHHEQSAFESRLAKMVMMALEHQSLEIVSTRSRSQSAQMIVGFGGIFKTIADGKSFNQIIAQSKLPEIYKPKRLFDSYANVHTENVRLMRKSDSGVQFILSGDGQDDEKLITRPYLPIFGLFALKSMQSTNQHPWRLGIVHWVQPRDEHLEVDGRFLGRLLSVCGIRLNGRDARSKDFVQALLVAGDGLNAQTTLVLPRYHFKEGDTVILRVDTKETTLRLEQSLLTTDDIEQYQIVRLTSG